jgi:hypothetical protein
MKRCLLSAVVWATLSALPVTSAEPPSNRQADVRDNGAAVMPFSITGTLHVFQKTPTGGIQRVEAREGNADQIPMIRKHLRMIAAAFHARHFESPAQIHGESMPGLATLRGASQADLEIVYRDIERGGEINYEGRTPTIRRAIHEWFDAQLADHGHDAMDHMHP